MPEPLRFLLTAALLCLALSVFVMEVLGVFRFRFTLSRMHAAALGDTFGLMLCMAALFVSSPERVSALKCLVLLLFMWMASPVSSHLIALLEVRTNPDISKETEERRL